MAAPADQDAERNTPGAEPAGRPHVRGSCFVCFAYDVGLSIDLDRAAALAGEATSRQQLPTQRRRGAPWLAYEPPPLRLAFKAGSIALPGTLPPAQTDASVDCTVFDFGAVSIRYRVNLDGPLAELPHLSDALYENWALLEDSRRRVEELCRAIQPAVTQPGIASLVEDYALFALLPGPGRPEPTELLRDHAPILARVLRAEPGALSEQQVRESVAECVSFGPGDVVLASWEAAIVLDPDPADVLTVLEHVNVELVEMRLLDRQLDGVLERAYRLLQRQAAHRLWPSGPGGHDLRAIATAQMDAAMLFESVNNAIKLVGDQHLARVYNLAAARAHLAEWDAAILRKLDTAESIYQKLTQFETGRRMEILEIVIVLLILIEVVMGVLARGH
ncbi:MAG: hypothetical protein IPJ41_05030 [Phycisphaerales bacterium]|nr:hypothetical protein [Phycisphaerales bacterium]